MMGALPRYAVLSGLVFLTLLQGAALSLNGGVFEYPLDDVYIHLAMAEGIWAGEYGVNPGEYASAASSALYPFLLLPIFPPEIQRLLPLFWNLVGLVLSAFLWGKMLLAAGYGQGKLQPIGVILALVGPVAMLMVSAAFVGMEHTLHAAASLAILYGLYGHLQGTPRPGWLLLGILFAPLFRFEGLALAVLAAGVLLITGARRQGLVALALAILPILGFCGFLLSLGLDPLPSSVQAKLVSNASHGIGFVARLFRTFSINLGKSGGMVVLLLVVGTLALLIFSNRLRQSRLRLFAFVLVLAGLGHMCLGQFGWMDRYDHYVVAIMMAGFVMLVPQALPDVSGRALGILVLIPIAVSLLAYIPAQLKYFPINPRAIYTQQGQMARFAKDYMNTAVAVNDLGLVAWNNENYVLDLWGLASAESRKKRIFDPTPGWAGPLAQAHDVPYAMIYETWLGRAVGPKWVRMGDLVLKKPQGFLGGTRVAFYATAPEHVAPLRAALAAWVPTLHELTYFDYADGMQ